MADAKNLDIDALVSPAYRRYSPVPNGLPPSGSSTQPIGALPYARLKSFLKPDVARQALYEMQHCIEYEQEQIAEFTRLWRAKAYANIELARRASSPAPATLVAISRLLAHPWLVDLLSTLVGEPVASVEPPKYMRLGFGDRVLVHDDTHRPYYRCAATLHLCENWRREDGGNFIIGHTISARPFPMPPGFPLNVCRHKFSTSRHVLTPGFNTLTVFRVRSGLAHGVTPVRSDKQRYGIGCLFGAAGSKVADGAFEYNVA